jgi:hypothetical protein
MTKASDKLRDILTKKLDEKQTALPSYIGQLGDGNNNVVVSGRPNYVYVRVSGRVGEVFNNRVSPDNDRYVWLGYDATEPEKEQVLDVVTGRRRYGEDDDDVYPTAINLGGFTWPNDNTIYMQLRQFMPLRVAMTDPISFGVSLYRGILNVGGVYLVVDTQDIDLITYEVLAEAAQAKYVLIEVSSTGTVNVVDGTETDLDSLTLSDIPSPSDGAVPLAAVRLYSGQSTVIETKTSTDIVDLRLADTVDGANSIYVDYIDFNTNLAADPASKEGRVWWNKTEYTINMDTGLGPVLQSGQEMFTIVYNDTVSQINDATAVYPTGFFSGNPTVEEADAMTHETIANEIAVTTMDIPASSIGLVTRNVGKLRDIDTSSFLLDDVIWIAANGGGVLNNLTNIRPSFPNYSVQIGGVSAVSATEGVIELAIQGRAIDTIQNFWNGTFREDFDFRITSDGATITGTLEPQNGHDDMTMIFSDGFTLLDTSPPDTITLTAGTDTNPQTNYVYVPQSTKVLTVSTSDWPTANEHIKVAQVSLQSAAAVQHHGALRNQNINDEVQDTGTNQGHLSHITERIRVLRTTWWSGCEGSLVGTPTSGYLAMTAGVAYQMHRQSVPILDMTQYDIDAVSTGSKTFTISDDGDLSSTFPNGRIMQVNDSTGNDRTYTVSSTNYSAPDFVITVEETIPDATADGTIGDSVYIVNDSVTAYLESTDLTDDLSSDSTGSTLNNRWFSIVFWISNNKSGEPGQGFVNLPGGSYTSEATAISDALNYSNYNIPTDFRGTGMLIARFTVRLSAGGLTYNAGDAYEDLREDSARGGGGGGGGATSWLGLTDTPSSYAGQAGKGPRTNSGETALEFRYSAIFPRKTQSDMTLQDHDCLVITGYIDLSYDIDMQGNSTLEIL